MVNLRLAAVGEIAKPKVASIAPAEGEAVAKNMRPVYFAESEGYVECPVYDRYALGAGAVVVGPAIVEEIDSTTMIHPGYQVGIGEFGHMVLTGVEANNQRE